MLWLRFSTLNLSSFPFMYSRDSSFLFYFEGVSPSFYPALQFSYCSFPSTVTVCPALISLT